LDNFTFVVDGMPVNSIDHILPETVQSISVLRGAAGSMYGSKGVNGIILITLKKSAPKKNDLTEMQELRLMDFMSQTYS
jgi:TonB-dependent SusC/RagA subfamily outer membrane receptor